MTSIYFFLSQVWNQLKSKTQGIDKVSALLLRKPVVEHGFFMVKRACQESNFTVEKTDRHFLRQVIKVNMNHRKSC